MDRYFFSIVKMKKIISVTISILFITNSVTLPAPISLHRDTLRSVSTVLSPASPQIAADMQKPIPNKALPVENRTKKWDSSGGILNGYEITSKATDGDRVEVTLTAPSDVGKKDGGEAFAKTGIVTTAEFDKLLGQLANHASGTYEGPYSSWAASSFRKAFREFSANLATVKASSAGTIPEELRMAYEKMPSFIFEQNADIAWGPQGADVSYGPKNNTYTFKFAGQSVDIVLSDIAKGLLAHRLSTLSLEDIELLGIDNAESLRELLKAAEEYLKKRLFLDFTSGHTIEKTGELIDYFDRMVEDVLWLRGKKINAISMPQRFEHSGNIVDTEAVNQIPGLTEVVKEWVISIRRAFNASTDFAPNYPYIFQNPNTKNVINPNPLAFHEMSRREAEREGLPTSDANYYMLETVTGEKLLVVMSHFQDIDVGVLAAKASSSGAQRIYEYPAGKFNVIVGNPFNDNYAKTSAGSISVGMSMLMRLLYPEKQDYPAVVIAPKGEWVGIDGSNLMQLYFAIAANYFFHGRKTVVVCRNDQRKRIEEYLKLGNPYELPNIAGYPQEFMDRLAREAIYLADRAKIGDKMQMATPFPDMVEFVEFSETHQAQDANLLGKVLIEDTGDGKFLIKDKGAETFVLNGQDMLELNLTFETVEPLTKKPEFGVTFLGTSSGMDANGLSSNHIVWAGARGILVDVGTQTIPALTALGLSPADITDVIITHLHEDHLAGALQYFKRCKDMARHVRLLMEPGMYELFKRLAKQVLDKDLEEVFDIEFIPLKFNDAVKLGKGADSVTIETAPAFHGTPTMMTRITCNGRTISHSSDTTFDPVRYQQIAEDAMPQYIRDDLQRFGMSQHIFDASRSLELSSFLFNGEPDMVIFEGGNKADADKNTSNHTTPFTLLQLPEETQKRIWVNHTAGLPAGTDRFLNHAKPMSTVEITESGAKASSSGEQVSAPVGLNLDDITTLTLANLNAAIETAKQGDIETEAVLTEAKLAGELPVPTFSRPDNLAGEPAKADIKPIIALNEESIPENQREVYKQYLKKGSRQLEELEKLTGCTIRLLSELGKGDLEAIDVTKHLIIISHKKMEGYEDAKYLNVSAKSDYYLPVAPYIGIAKLLLGADKSNVSFVVDALNKGDFYRSLFGRPANKKDVEGFLLTGIYDLPLPKANYEATRQKQLSALAAMMAA